METLSAYRKLRAAGPPTKPVLAHRRMNPLPLVANFVKKFTMFKVSNAAHKKRKQEKTPRQLRLNASLRDERGSGVQNAPAVW